MQRNTSKPNTQIAFRAREEDREHLRVLAAKARCSQGALLLKLLYDYGEAAARQLRGDSFTPESGLPEGNEQPIVHIFSDDNGYLTFTGRDPRTHERNPVASVDELAYYPDWVMANIPVGWLIRLREGVFGRNSEATADLVFVEFGYEH